MLHILISLSPLFNGVFKLNRIPTIKSCVMVWSEVAKGKFQRRIGENETFIKLLGDPGHALGREHWAINAIASIEPTGEWRLKDLETTFASAWCHLRFQQPSIASAAVDDKTLEYIVPEASALDEWTRETFHVVHDQDADQLASTIKPDAFAELWFLPDSGQILLHNSHWRTDGIGSLHLINALLELAVRSPLPDAKSLAWGEETSRLALPIEDAANIPVDLTPAIKDRAEELFKSFHLVAGAVGIPHSGRPQTVPGGTKSARATLSSEETAAVVARCKELGLSVTSAVHASVAAANYALADADTKQKHYTSTIRFTLRPYLPEPYSTSAHGSVIYTIGWMTAVPALSSWLENARTYNEEYRKRPDRGYLNAHRQYASQLCDLVRNMPQDAPSPSDVDISSIGVIEKYMKRTYGDEQKGVEVRSVSIGLEMLSPQGVVFLSTFRDQLQFHLIYNEAFHDTSQMQEFVQVLRGSLFQGLDMSR